MADSPRTIAHLIVNDGSGPKTAKVRLDGVVRRGLGIWPEIVTCLIAEDELAAAFPSSSLSKANVNIRIGTDTRNIIIEKWQVRDITPVDYGSTDGNSTVRAVTFRMTLEDARWKLQGDRGGVLIYGLMNPSNGDGEILPSQKVVNGDLVKLCIDAMPITYREGDIPVDIYNSLNAYEPMADLEWYGAHAPSELQRILEATRHAFAYNQDGTFSIVKLLDPEVAPSYPDIPAQYKTFSSANTIRPVTAEKCIIASCPTRVLVQRKSTLAGDYALVWVGTDVDGTIRPLEDLSWWPAGKTPLEVVRNMYRDVASDARPLAEASVFRMLRLSESDLAAGWTFTQRIVETFDLFQIENDLVLEPFTCRLRARTAVEDEHGAWVNASGMSSIEGATFDLQTGVITSPRLLVQVNGRTQGGIEPKAQEITSADDLEFIFGHHPSGGVTPQRSDKWWEDYFMVAYEWDGSNGANEITDGIPGLLLDGGDVPVVRYDFLELQYIERDDGTYAVDPYNLDALKARAEMLAAQYLTSQRAQIEYQEFVEMHDVDPDGSISEVMWDVTSMITAVRIRDHVRTANDLNRLGARDRQARGAISGAIVQAQSRGMLWGRSASKGPASGFRTSARQSIQPGAAGGGGGGGSLGSKGKRRIVREFPAEIEGSTRDGANWRWTYTLREWSKTGAGYGYERWNHPTGAVVVTGYNTYEYDNGEGGMLGIQVTVDELTACGQRLKPIETNTLVMVREVHVLNAGAPLTVEYWFSHPNGIEDVV